MVKINIIYFDENLGWVEDTLDVPGEKKTLGNPKTEHDLPKKSNTSSDANY